MLRKRGLSIVLILVVLAGLFPALFNPQGPVLAAAGIWQSYIILNSTYYDVNAATANPDFNGQNLGTFIAGSAPLALNGSQIKTYKNNGTDITSARLYYRIYPSGSPSGSFTSMNLPWNADLGGGDQQWQEAGQTVDLLSGLSDGNYVLEIYYEASTNGVNAAAIIYDNNGGSNYSASFTVSTPTPISVSAAKALWLDTDTIAWNGTAGNSYKLLYDPNGGLTTAAESTPCTFPAPAAPCYVTLTASGTVSGYPKNPNAAGKIKLLTGLSADNAKHLLRGQVVVASYNSGGTRLEATRAQIQSVLDALYAASAKTQTLGVTYSGGVPTLRVWAPTATSVAIRKYADSTTTISTTHALTKDVASGVWSVTGASGWDRQFYLLDVEVYVPSADAVVHNLVTDPYAISLSRDGTATGDVRSQFVNLADSNLKPTGWDSLAKPPLANFEDITIYEMHIRDFSINDSTVTTASHRGTYLAFTYDGAGPDPNTTLSAGMAHLLALQSAGLTHVHLLPTFDIATVREDVITRTVWATPSVSFTRSSTIPQTVVSDTRAIDSFNWGYDPYHYGAPEGSYSTDPNGAMRILEFRQMVQALNQNGLRVVMDVVYNHTAAAGQDDKSVFDKVVPGYYYRYTTNGDLYNSSCCADTAMEYEMMEKLMIDTVIRFAVDYKVDGFRFDLMNLHTRRNMENLKTAVQALTPASNGVEGDEIYLYGEGWTFGSAQDKGLTNCTDGWCFADKYNMTGSGIGCFNDIIRDATHGGYSTDDTGIRQQGFSNGLSYDWNGYYYGARYQSDLWIAADKLRSSLRGSGADWNGQGSPFTDDPQESVPYVEKHDNETLFDQNVFKLPSSTGIADRVRAQNVAQSLVALAQGVPFFQMGTDILRSKSLDRNTYDSGDWFNRVDWTYTTNYFGSGLPPAWDNESRWDIMAPLLTNTSFDPATADIQFAASQFREFLRIRYSSPLFRLTTESDIFQRTTHYNTNNSKDALIVYALSDEPDPDLDSNYETILVFVNANKIQQSITIAGANGFTLHPVQNDADDADPVVKTASFDDGADTFTIPARTTAVFVSTQTLTPPAGPSSLDWVGLMYPRGGKANAINQGAFEPSGFDVYVQVYEAGWTEGAGGNANISCTLYWGKYGAVWSELPMTWNAQKGNNDEYKVTLSQATLNALTPGTYGFTAYCKKSGEEGKKWKTDSYDIGGVGSDDDQGDGLITVIPAADSSAEPAGGVFVHLFEWRWADIQKECAYLAEKGYTAVQVSPPNEHLVPTENQGGQAASDFPWWARYQPVTHLTTAFTSRSGTWAEFQSMVTTCNALGVGIYVDAVINHTADIEVGDPPTGTAGTQYDSAAATRFYGTQYQTTDFHTDCNISSYSDRYQVQSCKLSGLPDLDTGKSDVQAELRNYLQALINAGVEGFRIDGAKHIAAKDLAAILDGLTGNFYVFQEVIDQSSNEPIRDWEYAPTGDVTEFAYAFALGAAFDNSCSGSLSDLASRFDDADMLPSRFAQVFTDNHDNQRGHGVGEGCVVDHRDGQEHILANIFALAYPYGHPSIMSSYYWQSDSTINTGDSMGPPTVNGGPGSSGATLPVYVDGDNTPDNCASDYTWGKWACEHRRAGVANMVQFRKVTAGQSVTWYNIGAAPTDHIAFSLGAKGFVAINRTASNATTTYQTGMPAGVYCDVIHGSLSADGTACTGPTVTVNASGQIVDYTVNTMDALAIHTGAQIAPPQIETIPAAPGIPFSGNTIISATVTNSYGIPVAGVTVSFVLTGAGSLSAASAAANAAGVAVVTYTAPATKTVAQITASFTATNSAVYQNSAYVYVAAATAAHEYRRAMALDHLNDWGVSLSIAGTDAPLLGVAHFAGNPCPSVGAGLYAKSAFVDAMLGMTSGVDSASLTLKYNNETGNESTFGLYWCNNGIWTAINDATQNQAANTFSFTLSNSTTPNLAQLEGTPFVVAGGQANAIVLASFQPASHKIPVAQLASLLALGGLMIAVYQKRRRK